MKRTCRRRTFDQLRAEAATVLRAVASDVRADLSTETTNTRKSA